MPAVSNTSPLSALAIIGCLDILRVQFGSILIPRAVWNELGRLENHQAKQALERACEEGWLQVQETTKHSLVEVLGASLDEGSKRENPDPTRRAAGISGGRGVRTQGEESKGLKVKSRRSARHSRVFDFRLSDL